MRSVIYSFQQREVLREIVVFALVITACIFIIAMLCQAMPVQKRFIDLVVQSTFSAMMAVPAGASWRSLRRTMNRYRDLHALRENSHEVG